jgi:hypothetical protein
MYLMDSGNANTWHNQMYESYMLAFKKMFNVYFVFNNPNLSAPYKRSNIIDYMDKYEAYK